MKRLLISLICLLVVFVVSVSLYNHSTESSQIVAPETDANNAVPPSVVATTVPDDSSFTPEFDSVVIPAEENSTEPYRSLLITRDGDTTIGECESQPSWMKSWIVVFRKGNRFTREKRKVHFGRKNLDGFGPYLNLLFKGKENAVFMFTDTGELTAGLVQTIPESLWKTSTKDGISDFNVGSRKIIRLGDQQYLLRVATGVRENKAPVSVLVVESGERSQIVFYKWFDQQISPEMGDFEWLGDFDGDGRLDFIFSYYDQNGGGQSFILFASSIAKSGELVRPYAFYHTRFRGC
jgi:hypothetical protein